MKTPLMQKLEDFNSNAGKEFYLLKGTGKLTDDELLGLDLLIRTYLGQRVTIVCMSGYFIDELAEFENTIRVTSILEYSEERKQYRVITDDESAYCYFTIKNVVELGTYGNEKDFSNNAKAVIAIKF